MASLRFKHEKGWMKLQKWYLVRVDIETQVLSFWVGIPCAREPLLVSSMSPFRTYNSYQKWCKIWIKTHLMSDLLKVLLVIYLRILSTKQILGLCTFAGIPHSDWALESRYGHVCIPGRVVAYQLLTCSNGTGSRGDAGTRAHSKHTECIECKCCLLAAIIFQFH